MRIGLRRGIAVALLVLCAALVAGCGSAGPGALYSVQQVKSAFAAQGIVLHRDHAISMRGVHWFASGATGRRHEPGVTVVVLREPGDTSFYESGSRTVVLKKLGDVRAVIADNSLTNGVDAALAQLSKESAPAVPAAPTTAPPQLPTFAQLLARLPQPLRAAVRKTANAPSAHVVLTGEMSGSGDYSTVRKLASLRSHFAGYRMNEVVAGTTLYRSSSSPGSAIKPFAGKWIKEDLSQLHQAITGGWPELGFLTVLQPLAALPGTGHVATVGRQRIQGVETTHYRERISFGGGQLPSVPKMAIAEVVDVWVGRHDGLIHRASECFAGMNVFTANLSRFGEDVHVTIPSGPNVITPPTTPGKLTAQVAHLTSQSMVSSRPSRCR